MNSTVHMTVTYFLFFVHASTYYSIWVFFESLKEVEEYDHIMPIAEVASLVGGAALGAPFSEILKLVIEGAKKVKDFKPLSEDLASTMERLVPIFEEIDRMQRGSGTDELKLLIKTIKRAEEMVHKCSRVQWYSIAKRALYSKEIRDIHQDFLKFCQIELQLIQHRNQLQHMYSLASVTTKMDLLSITGKESSELFLVPPPQEVTVCWLGRSLRELKKVLFEDKVVTTVVFASSACGKTSLVTKLCHDVDVKGKFRHILFITVSKAPNIRLIVHKLLELTGCNANEFASNFDARLCIQQLLMQLRQSGSVLFVLDDVWPEEESLLEKFLIQLTDYKILVTSRFEFPSFGPTFHLEPLIDEDVKNLFIEFAPDPNCASCSKLDHSIQKILKGCSGLPLAMNHPCSIFDGCNSVIEHGNSGDVLGALLHHKCLQCDACHKPIATQEIENHVSNSRGKFHKACYGRYCYVCKEKVKIRMFNQHPFWKENYCPAHGSDGTPKCCSCERLEPRGTNYVRLCDGRWLCLECMESAVMDTDEVQPLHFEIREFFEGLNMRIEKEFPLLMVGKQALNKAEEDEKIDYQSEVVTRALCLSEELIISAVSKRPRMGPNRQLTGIVTESQKVVRKCEITAILIIYGLPKILTGYLLACEMMHAWLRLKGHRNLNKVLEAGICQVVGHMWLESYTYASTDASGSKEPVCSVFEKRLVEFCKNQIETDESPIYGVGFKRVNQMVTYIGLQETLREIIRRS